MSVKTISYRVYAGSSARFFPNVKSLINVKADLYQKWELNPESIDFKDVLVDPKNPVQYVNDENRLVKDVQAFYLDFWYQTTYPMEIARKTAERGRETNGLTEKELKEPPIAWSLDDETFHLILIHPNGRY